MAVNSATRFYAVTASVKNPADGTKDIINSVVLSKDDVWTLRRKFSRASI